MRAFVLLFLACSGPSDPGDAGRDAGALAIDAGSDAGMASDAGRGIDAGMFDASAIDAGMSDAGMFDAGRIDAGSATDLGPVACRDDSECGAGQRCDVSAPGGRCQDCAGSCVSSDFECLFGACLRSCTGDGDCNIGMRCASFAEGQYCRPRTCADCPAPYVCTAGACARPACDASFGCPSPLTCRDGTCVEP